MLRQRNALLRQSGGRLTPEVEVTLDVWDAKLIEVGEALARERLALLDELVPVLADAYDQVAHVQAEVTAIYRSAWLEQGLAAALADGPHATSCAAGSAWSDRTATTSSWPSAASRPAPTRRRASSDRWPWPCAWPPTGW